MSFISVHHNGILIGILKLCKFNNVRSLELRRGRSWEQFELLIELLWCIGTKSFAIGLSDLVPIFKFPEFMGLQMTPGYLVSSPNYTLNFFYDKY